LVNATELREARCGWPVSRTAGADRSSAYAVLVAEGRADIRQDIALVFTERRGMSGSISRTSAID
jgi:hypothetical protein